MRKVGTSSKTAAMQKVNKVRLEIMVGMGVAWIEEQEACLPAEAIVRLSGGSSVQV